MNSSTATPPQATPEEWPLDEVVAASWATIASCGWTPVTSESPDRLMTRVLVHQVLTGGVASPRYAEPILRSLPAGHQRAGSLLAALRRSTSQCRTTPEELEGVLQAGRVARPDLALIVTAVATQMGRGHRPGRLDLRGRRRPTPDDQVGALFERITACGTVTRVRTIRGFTRGTHNVHLIIDCGDFTVRLVAGRHWVHSVELGDEVTVSGDVRGHQLADGRPQTVLSDTQPVPQPEDAPRKLGHSRPGGVRHRFQVDPNPSPATLAGRTAP
jgi:hypothetical protein